MVDASEPVEAAAVGSLRVGGPARASGSAPTPPSVPKEAAMAAFPTCRPAGDQLLRLRREVHQLGVIIRVAGEIDLSSHLELRTEVFDACNAVRPPSPVVLDLTEVEFLASVGLTELLLCHERAIA